MTTIMPYAGTSDQRLANLINVDNSSALQLGVDFTLGGPEVYSDSSGRNTKVVVTPTDPDKPPQEFHYSRLPLTVLNTLPVGSVQPMADPQFPFTVHGSLDAINANLGLNLTAAEITDAQYTQPQARYPLSIDDSVSLAWLGSDYSFPATYQILTVRNDDANFNDGYNAADGEVWALSKTFPVQEDGSILLIYRYDSTTLAAKGVITTAGVGPAGITAASIISGPSSYNISNGTLVSLGTITTADGVSPALFGFNSSNNTLKQIVAPFGAGVRNFQFVMVATSQPMVYETVDGDTTFYELNGSTLALSATISYPGRTVTQVISPSVFASFFIAPTGTTNDPTFPMQVIEFNVFSKTFQLIYTHTEEVVGLIDDDGDGTIWVIGVSGLAVEFDYGSDTLTGRQIDMSDMLHLDYRYDGYNSYVWGSSDANNNGYQAKDMNGNLIGIFDSVVTPQIVAGTVQRGFVVPNNGIDDALFLQMDLPDPDSGVSQHWLARVPMAYSRTS